ncbi:hypothetical protein MtrunA17_Chr1g0182981 [Medicago truncatula]|uniref:Uncharacterized protein n=1 Tax=Medicago truncatula TaxID=3880 RepID=A0A396JRT6_MEDTR|nr:hypothetical protein MtrunA17_Chr1g0182981 [Medicago truncatula]
MTPDVAKPVVEELDFVKNFFTKKKFTSRDDLLDWGHCEATKLCFAIIISKSYLGFNQRKQFLILRCERGGVI